MYGRALSLTGRTVVVLWFALVLAAGVSDNKDPTEPPLLRTLEGHTATVKSIAISDDKRLLASGSEDKTTRLWEVATGKLRFTFSEHGSSVDAVALAPGAKILATAERDGVTTLWDTTTANELGSWWTGAQTELFFSPTGRTLVTAGSEGLNIWDIENWRLIATIDEAKWVPIMTKLAFAPDGKTFAVFGFFKPVRLWSAETGELVTTLEWDTERPRTPMSISFSSDGGSLAIGTTNGEIWLWDLTQRKVARILKGRSGMISKVTFRNTEELTASGVYGIDGMPPEVVIWDVEKNREAAVIRPSSTKASAIKANPAAHCFAAEAFSIDGSLWATAGADHTVRLWSLQVPAVISARSIPVGRGIGLVSGREGCQSMIE